MDTRFFQSKEFVIAAVVAGVLILGGVAASGVIFETGLVRGDGCTVATPPGQALEPVLEDTGLLRANDRFERVVTYTLNTAPDGPAVLEVCTDVGNIDVIPSANATYRLTFTITNDGPGADEAVDRSKPGVTMTEAAGQLHIAADQPEQLHSHYLFNSQSTRIDVELEVPAGQAHRLEARTDVGEIHLAPLAFGELTLATDVGDIEGQSLDLRGRLEAATDVGDVELRMSSVTSASWEVETDVGEVHLELPESLENGYDVTANADVGSITLVIGETEHQRHEEHGASEEAEARTAGYASKAHQVRIDVETDVGAIRITT